MTAAEIGDRLQYSASYIRRLMKRYRIPARTPKPNARWSCADVALLQQRLEEKSDR